MNQFLVTYSLNKGMKQFGEAGRSLVLKEMKQLHERKCFTKFKIIFLTRTERRRALESLIFSTEKKDGANKARHCANGSPQRDLMNTVEVSSPTINMNQHC
jgi:hypothetical protein